MIKGEQTLDDVSQKEIRTVAKAWASSYGYRLKEPLMIVPLLTLVPDGEQIMSVRLEGWSIFAQTDHHMSGQEVTITFRLNHLAGSAVPDEVPKEC
jgi:hypothetical protein